MRAFVTAMAVVTLGLGVWGCGGNSYTSWKQRKQREPDRADINYFLAS